MEPLCSIAPVRTGLLFFLRLLAVSVRRRAALIITVLLFSVTLAPEARAATPPPPLWECKTGYHLSVTVASGLQTANECIEPLKAYGRDHAVPFSCAISSMTGFQIVNIWLDSTDRRLDGKSVRYGFGVGMLIYHTGLGSPFGCSETGIADGEAWVQKCPVPPLSSFPPAGDLCAASLEAGRGQDVNNACPPLDPRMQEAKACLDTKIAYALGGNVSTAPEATIRTQAYQNHLLEIYKKWLALKNLTPEEKAACTTIKAKIDGEKQKHGLIATPSTLGPDAPHVLKLAVDMDLSTVIYPMASTMAGIDGVGGMSLIDYLRNPVGTTQGCKLCWGGTFPEYDPVHIQYCP